jgi:transcriptional regulator with PAS, ATPase and Fis domain
MIAHAIHNSSKRYLDLFIKINCSAIPPELLESKLFIVMKKKFLQALKKVGKKESLN